MHKMMLMLDCGVGMSETVAYIVNDADYREWKSEAYPNTLDNFAWSAAVEFAESYGIYPLSDQTNDCEDEDYDPGTEYSEDISGHWEEYDPERHDGHMIGNQAQWDWVEI